MSIAYLSHPRHDKRVAVAWAVWLGIAIATPAAAATDYLELRERLELGRPALQAALQPFRRVAPPAFAQDKPGEAFGRYLGAAWKVLDAPRAFPEVHAALAKWNGHLAVDDAGTRQAFAVLLGDYMQVRYGDDLKRELAALVACKSYDNIVDRNADNPEIRKAIETVADLGVRLGLQVQPGAEGTLRIGFAGAPQAPPVAVWTHVDVPRPVEHKWVSSPWTLTDRDERWFGLGVYDGKGPTIVNLFVLRALRDSGLKAARPVVLVVSSHGEQFAVQAAAECAPLSPALALGAAGEFPYAEGEFGRVLARVASTRGMKSRTGIKSGEFYIHKMQTVTAANTVPSEVRTWVRYEPPANATNPSHVMVNEKWRPTIEKYQKEFPATVYETYVQDDTLHFFAYGHPRHVQHAASAENSIYSAAGALLRLPLFRNSSAVDILRWVDSGLRRDPSGKTLGLDHRDAEMGATTVVPVGFDRLGDEVAVWVDIRWPVGRDAAWVRETFTAAVAKFDAANGTKLRVTWEPGEREPSRAELAPAVRAALEEAYGLASGESAPPVAATASGAHMMPGLVPFGPEWPRGEMRAHTRDESISRREVQDLGVAYAAALSHLLALPSLPVAP